MELENRIIPKMLALVTVGGHSAFLRRDELLNAPGRHALR
jgi:hypothetical protein